VARASFLRHAAATHTFDWLANWATAYAAHHSDVNGINGGGGRGGGGGGGADALSSGGGDAALRRHSLFYAISQSLFYIFCYRKRAFGRLLAKKNNAAWDGARRLQTIVNW
jgi:hypothetical protein